jgi:PBSX family phage terminase large subunit
MVNNVLSPKQIDSIATSTKRMNIWEGAVRSGKSFSCLIAFVDHVMNGPPGDMAIIGRTQDTIKRNIVSELHKLLGTDPKYYSGKRELLLYGRLIHIIGASDERAEGKIRGATLAGALVDEASLIPESFFTMLLSRLSIKGAKLYATTNPDTPFHYLKRDYLDRSGLDIARFKFNLDDNPSLTEDYKNNLKKEYRGLWYKRYILGEWCLAEGAVYDFFDEAIHTIEVPPGLADYYICGVDYGTNNPTAFSLVGVSQSLYPNLWMEKEYYYSWKDHQRQKTDSEFAKDLKDFLVNYNVSAVYMDPSALSFKTECYRTLPYSIIEANNEVLDGIRYVSNLLINGTLKIKRNCRKTIEEFQSYRWDEKANRLGIDKPCKQNDHILDSLRYQLLTHFNGKEIHTTFLEDWRSAKRKHSSPSTIEDFFRV